MTRQSYTIQGDLVRDVWDHEYDQLEVGAQGLEEYIIECLGPGREEVLSRSTRKTYFGRVRITIETLE